MPRPSSMTTTLPNPAPPATAEAHGITWPDALLPAQASVFVSNELIIPTPAAAIWPWLIRAELWPNWYPNSADIHFLSHAGPDLRDRSRFRWRSFGISITSKVREFVPGQRLAWSTQGIGLDAYHAWLLIPIGECATRVVTQETQTGWLARLHQTLMPRRIAKQHQLWLERLSACAQAGQPPHPASPHS